MSLIHPFTASLTRVNPKKVNSVIDGWVSFFANPICYVPINNPIDFDPWDSLPILLVDQKDDSDRYWRHTYFSSYKTGRPEKSAFLKIVRDRVLDKWKKNELPYLSESGFEADDWAGALVKYTGPCDKISLVSVDSDWAQLVSDRVMWLDVYPPSLRTGWHQKQSVLGVSDVLDRFNNKEIHKRTFLLDRPSDLVRHKHIYGDKSDRIPGGCVVPIGIIDLEKPVEEPTGADGRVKLVLQHPYNPPPINPYASHIMFGVPDWLGGNNSD
jgi:hypothetical protein